MCLIMQCLKMLFMFPSSILMSVNYCPCYFLILSDLNEMMCVSFEDDDLCSQRRS
jgi:hypothetical protein